MKRRDLFYFLGLELLAIAWAGGSFALISSKLAAGFVAGAYFIASAAWMLARLRAWPRPARALTLYPLVVHLFAISIPMVLTRAYYADRDFESVRILGLAGPDFHRLSTSVFSVLILATVMDLARTFSRSAIEKAGQI